MLLVATAGVQTPRTPTSARARRVWSPRSGDHARPTRRGPGGESPAPARSASRPVASRPATPGQTVQTELDRLGRAPGRLPATGRGVKIVVDDALRRHRPAGRLRQDLQILVNGLWDVGAEAVSINGQRLTSLSAIRSAGEAINVNFRSMPRPYVVTAIGDPDQLPARFVDIRRGTWWFNLSRSTA